MLSRCNNERVTKMRVGNVGKGQFMALWLVGAIVVALRVGIWLYMTYPH